MREAKIPVDWPAPLIIANARYRTAISRSYALYLAGREAQGDELRSAFLTDQIQAAEREEDESWEPWEELYQLWMDGHL